MSDFNITELRSAHRVLSDMQVKRRPCAGTGGEVAARLGFPAFRRQRASPHARSGFACSESGPSERRNQYTRLRPGRVAKEDRIACLDGSSRIAGRRREGECLRFAPAGRERWPIRAVGTPSLPISGSIRKYTISGSIPLVRKLVVSRRIALLGIRVASRLRAPPNLAGERNVPSTCQVGLLMQENTQSHKISTTRLSYHDG